MIQFRCWYCNRYWRKPAEEYHTHLVCRCGEPIRVPRREWGSSQPWSFKNWLIRGIVHGGFCAAMGFLFGYAYIFRFGAAAHTPAGAIVFASFVAVPGLGGFLGGERAINFLAHVAGAMSRSSASGGG